MATGLGIDVGSESIKIVQVRVSGATVSVTGALKIPRAAESVLDAPAAETATEFVPENLGEELKRAHLGRSGTVGISGREVNLRYLPLAPMPPDKLKMVLDMEITGRLTAKGPAAAAGSELTYDYRILNTPSGLKGDLVVMAGLCKNSYLFGVNSSLNKAGVDAKRVTPSCFGLVNAYLRTQKEPSTDTVVLLEVGHELLEIAILEGNNLYFARSAPGGGKKFTAGLDKILKVGEAKAAEFKQNRVKLHPEGAQIPSKQELAFQAALKEAADNIAGSIRSSLMFCRTQAKLPKLDYQRIILSGGGARLAGFREYLEKKTGRPVQTLDIAGSLDLRRLDAASGRCFDGEIPDMGVALGLAIIDADPKSFHFALVPEALAKKRVFWKRTVYGFGASAVLVAGLYWPAGSSSQAAKQAAERAAMLSEKKDEARKERKDFAGEVEQNKATVKKVEYFARLTRMNHVYLDFYTKLRAELPADIILNYVGPATADAAVAGMGSWTAVDEPVMSLAVRGVYDPEAYPGAKFDEAWDGLRKKLMAIPGIRQAEREPMVDADTVAKDGRRFQWNIVFQDYRKPLAAAAPEPAAAATPENKQPQERR